MAPFLSMINIRKYKNEDLEQVFEIYKQARDSDFFLGQTVDKEEDFLQLVEDEDIYVVQVVQVVVAFISVYPMQSFVHHLYVLPAYQKRGFGKALIDYIRNKYEHPLSLKCEKQNEPAISFYRSSGWKIFKNGSEIDGTEYILMTLDLD
ncbi:MAG: GNAT family N-acetyltransferase [Lentisphaeraceae bacterium]|nr:GNAT family N-acetyltransferase [Lentisphaeraceae bacterium]